MWISVWFLRLCWELTLLLPSELHKNACKITVIIKWCTLSPKFKSSTWRKRSYLSLFQVSHEVSRIHLKRIYFTLKYWCNVSAKATSVMAMSFTCWSLSDWQWWHLVHQRRRFSNIIIKIGLCVTYNMQKQAGRYKPLQHTQDYNIF